MKKYAAFILSAAMLFGCLTCLAAGQAANPYELFSSLLNGRAITLTVTAGDVDLPEEMAVPTEMVWTVIQENDTVLLEITCGGESMVKAVLTSEGAVLDTALEELPHIECSWAALSPIIELTQEGKQSVLKVRMTGPNQELINFTAKVTGTGTDCYAVSFQAGLITGPGVIYGIYDDFDVQDGASTRCFAYTWDESMLSMEGEGEEICAEDGTITRTDVCSVLLDDDEIGCITLHSVLVIR